MMHLPKLLLILFLLTGINTAYTQEKGTLLFADEVFFATGSYQLQQIYYKRLEELAMLIKEKEVKKIIIQAHTDSVGSSNSNEKLSFNRAEAIVNFLKEKEVDLNLMSIRTYGEYSPIANNRTEEGRARNRRVSITVLGHFDESKLFNSAKIYGKVLDASSSKPLVNARVLMNYIGGRDTLYTDENGYYEQNFKVLTNVEVRVYAESYFFISKLAKLKNNAEIALDFNLEPAIVGGKMFLSDLYFKAGTALLLPSSEKALEGILTFMEYNKQLKIEVGGHINKPNVDRVHPRSSSFKLSEDRAKAVYDFLLENGIEAERLQFQGYGNWEMIHPEAKTELQMQMNRRVELKIIE